MWKKIPGFRGQYEISSSGLVRNAKTKKILTPHPTKDLYLRVQLQNNGEPVNAMVHVLVAKTYLPTAEKNLDVNHKNNNRQDNRVANLEWITHSANCKQVWVSGKKAKIKQRTRRKLVMKEIRKRVRHVMTEKEWDMTKLAKIIGTSRNFASQKLNGCGNAVFTLNNLIAISDASGYSLDYLVGRSER